MMSFLVGVVLCSMTATGPGAAQQPELESEPSAHHMNRAVLVSQAATDQDAQITRARGLVDAGQFQEALEILRPLATIGNAKAQNLLGVMYVSGRGVKQDPSQARLWFTRAAEAGDSGAQCNLGQIYDRGVGVERNHALASQWFEKSAHQGNVQCQVLLGSMYALGEGVDQNFETAFGWYQKAADQGDAEAQRRVGQMYLEGQGVGRNPSKARVWLERAATQGNVAARGILDTMAWPDRSGTVFNDQPGTPLSERMGIVSTEEIDGLGLLGRRGGPTVVINRRAVGADLGLYATFDHSVVFVSGLPSGTVDSYESLIRAQIGRKSRDVPFRLVDHAASGAGIASLLSAFEVNDGRGLELVLLVFDRRKSDQIRQEKPALDPLPLVLESTVWIAVVRVYENLELGKVGRDPLLDSTINRLFDAGFMAFATAGFQLK